MKWSVYILQGINNAGFSNELIETFKTQRNAKQVKTGVSRYSRSPWRLVEQLDVELLDE